MNFAVVAAGGEAGGEGGISKLGTGGIVRLRTSWRLAVYGDAGGCWTPSSESVAVSRAKSDGIVGPGAGPRAGPIEAELSGCGSDCCCGCDGGGGGDCMI